MAKKRRHPLYPEPGAWVVDDIQGMPRLEPPPPLPDGPIPTDELRDQYVAYEGLGYCLYTYIPADRVEDKTLRALWRKARRAMQDVVEYLEI